MKGKSFFFLLVVGLLMISLPAMADSQNLNTQVKIPEVEKNVELPPVCSQIGGTWRWNNPHDHSQGGKCVVNVRTLMLRSLASACRNRGGVWQNNKCIIPFNKVYPNGRALCRTLGGTWQNNKCKLCR